MSEIKLISPMLDDFLMGDPISDQNGVRCCPAMKNDSDDRYIVKIISSPSSQKRLEALLLAGAYPHAQAAKAYFSDQANDIVQEYNILKKLSEQEGFISFLDCQTVEMDGGETGYDVYLLAPYKRTLLRQFNTKPITHLAAINLGLDICSALSACRRCGYLYINLKPSNIYIINDSEFKIGDLGFAKLSSLKYASLPDKYRSQYTAPELANPFANPSTTMDTYALGLILYQVYNGGTLPFSGTYAPNEKLPAPEYADYEMAEIILKACDPDPANRWQDPVEMGQALVGYMQRNGANDTPIVPPVIPLVETEPVENTAESEICEEIEDIDCAANTEEATDAQPEEIEFVPDESEDVVTEAESSEEESPEEEIQQIEEPDPLEEIVSEFAQDAPIPTYIEDENGNLSFMNSDEDETTQAVDSKDIEYEEISEEVSQMMVQVDEIADHPVPDPVVVPDEIIVPVPEFPEPVAEDSEENSTEDLAQSDEQSAIEEADSESEETTETTEAEEPVEETEKSEEEDTADNADESEDEADDFDEDYLDPPPKRHRLRNALLILAALALIAGGILFYKFYYLQTIDELKLTGSENTLTVEVVTEVDESALTVTIEAYGNKISKPLVNGKAEFTDLIPNTTYRVELSVDGFHKLTGQVEGTHYTPAQSNLQQLEVTTGSEDGSAIISFTIDGPTSDKWKLEYVTDGEAVKTEIFDGASGRCSVTLTGLTIGKTYTAKLIPETSLYLNGEQTITFTASKRISAENLTITRFVNSSLTVSWEVPADAIVTEWIVICTDETGKREVVTTAQNTYSFQDIDTTKNYSVEVRAAGQSITKQTSVTENSITIDPISAEMTANGQIRLSWECSEEIPDGGWSITYQIPGTEIANTVTCEKNNYTIAEAIPGQSYDITINAVNGTPIVCAPISIRTKDASAFSMKVGNSNVTSSNIKFSMCFTPNTPNWGYKDLNSKSYTTSFKVGQKASFLLQANRFFGSSDASIAVLYVVCDKEGTPLCTSHENFTWNSLWDQYYDYGALNISTLPSEPGNYTVYVYFNGGLIKQQDFKITE